MLTLNGGTSSASGTDGTSSASTRTPGVSPTLMVASTVGGAMRQRRPWLASWTPAIASVMCCAASDGFSTATVSVFRSPLSAALTSRGKVSLPGLTFGWSPPGG